MLLLTTSYKGGEVVYRYGIGVISLPKVHNDGGHDSHSHGEKILHKSKEIDLDETSTPKIKVHDHSAHKH